MTSPAVDTGIVAFIEARCEADDVVAFHMEDRRQEAAMRRAILALHRPDHAGEQPWCVADGRPYPCQTVRLLAAVDDDHPAFDPSWKPVAG